MRFIKKRNSLSTSGGGGGNSLYDEKEEQPGMISFYFDQTHEERLCNNVKRTFDSYSDDKAYGVQRMLDNSFVSELGFDIKTACRIHKAHHHDQPLILERESYQLNLQLSLQRVKYSSSPLVPMRVKLLTDEDEPLYIEKTLYLREKGNTGVIGVVFKVIRNIQEKFLAALGVSSEDDSTIFIEEILF